MIRQVIGRGEVAIVVISDFRSLNGSSRRRVAENVTAARGAVVG
jgi:hypothetical protein